MLEWTSSFGFNSGFSNSVQLDSVFATIKLPGTSSTSTSLVPATRKNPTTESHLQKYSQFFSSKFTRNQTGASFGRRRQDVKKLWRHEFRRWRVIPRRKGVGDPLWRETNSAVNDRRVKLFLRRLWHKHATGPQPTAMNLSMSHCTTSGLMTYRAASNPDSNVSCAVRSLPRFSYWAQAVETTDDYVKSRSLHSTFAFCQRSFWGISGRKRRQRRAPSRLSLSSLAFVSCFGVYFFCTFQSFACDGCRDDVETRNRVEIALSAFLNQRAAGFSGLSGLSGLRAEVELPSSLHAVVSRAVYWTRRELWLIIYWLPHHLIARFLKAPTTAWIPSDI